MAMTNIYLQKVYGTDGLVFVELHAAGAPRHFLGLAADVRFSGDFAEADYRGMEWGEVVSILSFEEKPINMVKALPGDAKIVLGITFKANSLPDLPADDFVMARFVFGKDAVAPAGFGNQVLSIYEDGRKDLGDVSWEVRPAGAQAAQAMENPQSPLGAQAMGTGGQSAVNRQSNDEVGLPQNGGLAIGNQVSEHGTQTNFQEAGLLSALNYKAEVADSTWIWIVGGVLITTIIITIIAITLYLSRRGHRQRHLSDVSTAISPEPLTEGTGRVAMGQI